MARLAAMEATIGQLQSENQSLRQQVQQPGVGSSPSDQRVERLLEMMTEQLRILGERSRPTLVDVKGIGKPTVFKNEDARFHEWAKKTEDYLVGVVQGIEDMIDWACEEENEITLHAIDQKFGLNADPIEQVEGAMQIVTQLKTVLSHLTEGESWTIVQNCGRSGLEAWRRLHRRRKGVFRGLKYRCFPGSPKWKM